MAEIWTHRDIADNVFTLKDLLDAWDLIDVISENSRRQEAYEKRQTYLASLNNPGG